MRRRAALAVAGVIVALTLLAQLFLPGFAEHKLRGDLRRYGDVERADISAFPAVKLLIHHADRVTTVMGHYRAPGSGGRTSLGDFLASTRGVGRLDARVGVLQAGLVTLHDVRLSKHGDQLVGRARLTDAALRDALPDFVDVRPIASGSGQIIVQATIRALGRRIVVRARAFADKGRIRIGPDSPLLGGLVSLTVWNDDRVAVESLDAARAGGGYELTARARLR